MSKPVTLAVTPGEPAGIGPDIALHPALRDNPDVALLLFADPHLLKARATALGVSTVINDYAESGCIMPGQLNVYPVTLLAPVVPGQLNPDNAPYVLRSLELALAHCEDGTCDALVTGPVNKAVINDHGIRFSGHTEWLAEKTGTHQVVMLLATDGLMVALATTHLPLRDVADAITPDSLTRTLTILHTDLRTKFGIASPRILVLGLNPHAGESGHLGREEIDIIIPVLNACREQGMVLTGPVPADTAFSPRLLGSHDAVLAMFHDQGLPVLKYKGFGAAANITLGLPLIRTSVDHGTALDIAGSGRADPASLRTAMDYAVRMVGRRQTRSC